MKKLYTLIAILCLGTSLSAQTIPNGGFENWNNTNGYPEPDNWATFNIMALFSGTDYGVTQGTPGAVGSSYCKLTCTDDGTGVASPAVALTGTLNILTGTGTTGFPVNSLPNFLSGQYRASINGDDIAGVICFFTKWNAANNASDTLAIAQSQFATSQASWTNFETPVIPVLSGVPDSCVIVLIAGGGNVPEIGNYMDIDDLHFSSSSSVSEADASPFQMFPNPAHNMLNLDLSRLHSNADVSIYSGSGALVRREQLKNGMNTMDISDLASGLYTVQIYDGSKRWSQLLIKQD